MIGNSAVPERAGTTVSSYRPETISHVSPGTVTSAHFWMCRNGAVAFVPALVSAPYGPT